MTIEHKRSSKAEVNKDHSEPGEDGVHLDQPELGGDEKTGEASVSAAAESCTGIESPTAYSAPLRSVPKLSCPRG